MEAPETKNQFTETKKVFIKLSNACQEIVPPIIDICEQYNIWNKELEETRKQRKKEKKQLRKQKRMETIKNIGEGFLWGIAILFCIAGCPFIPLVWLIIHTSIWIWIWFLFDIGVTILLIYTLYEAASTMDHIEEEEEEQQQIQ